MYGPGIVYGGADRFIEVIQREIKPRVASLAHLNATKSTLVGHSLGGLFVLRTLFRHPEYFASYVALSPSIWWEDRVVLRDEAAFEARVRSGAVRPVIFLSVDGLEQTMTQSRIPPGYTRAKLAAELKRVAMVDNAVALGRRLAATTGRAPYHVTFHEYAGREHVDAMWASVDDFIDTVVPL
jgi:predicted alpha/beta superfamily hydrolase